MKNLLLCPFCGRENNNHKQDCFIMKLLNNYEFCANIVPKYELERFWNMRSTPPKYETPEQYKELFESGNKAQQEKLLKYEKERKGLYEIDLYYALSKIYNNYNDINKCLYAKYRDNSNASSDIDFDLLRSKAANLANFAHMIIYQCDEAIAKKYRKTDKGEIS